MRTLFLSLLCAALVFAAAARTTDAAWPPCPMQHPGQGMASGAEFAGTCCNDADAAARTGKPCKTGQECQTSPSAPPLPPPVTASPGPSAPLAETAPTAPERYPTPIWRPPARV